jgi:hypothetical protein
MAYAMVTSSTGVEVLSENTAFQKLATLVLNPGEWCTITAIQNRDLSRAFTETWARSTFTTMPTILGKSGICPAGLLSDLTPTKTQTNGTPSQILQSGLPFHL